MERIPFCAPAISDQDVQYVAESVPHCTDERTGDFQHRFERAFAEYIGVRHAFAVSSRSAAIHVAMASLQLEPGQEVIVPEIAPASTLVPLRYLGVTPTFADVDPQSWCLSVDSFKKAITPRTRALLVVDLYGNIPEMHRIRAIAHAHGISIVEDASDAIGGEYLGRRAGSLGDVGVFGFDRAETLTSGEGGMVVTACDQIAAGIQKSLCDAGFDYHISPMQAALGVSQLERIDELVARKVENAACYRLALGGLSGVTFSTSAPGAKCVPNEMTVAFDATSMISADHIADQLALRDIECRRMFQPASSLGMYSNLAQARVARGRNHVSYSLSQRAISLPSGTNLTKTDIDYVAAALRTIVAQQARFQPKFSKAA